MEWEVDEDENEVILQDENETIFRQRRPRENNQWLWNMFCFILGTLSLSLFQWLQKLDENSKMLQNLDKKALEFSPSPHRTEPISFISSDSSASHVFSSEASSFPSFSPILQPDLSDPEPPPPLGFNSNWGPLFSSDYYKDAWITHGNPLHLNRVYNKLIDDNQRLNILVMGGSVTEGHEVGQKFGGNLWINHLEKWLGKRKVRIQNQAVSGTGTNFGMHKIDHWLTKFPADLLIVEYALNDNTEKDDMDEWSILRDTELLLRKIIYEHPSLSVIYLEGYRTKRLFRTGEDQHQVLLRYYGIPGISIRNALWHHYNPTGGVSTEKDIQASSLHPNEWGHKVWADIFIHCLTEQFQDFARYGLGDHDWKAIYGDPVNRAIPLFATREEIEDYMQPYLSKYDNGATTGFLELEEADCFPAPPDASKWVGAWPEIDSVQACVDRLMQDSECDHRAFKHATNGDGACACLNPKYDWTNFDSVCPNRRQQGYGIVLYKIVDGGIVNGVSNQGWIWKDDMKHRKDRGQKFGWIAENGVGQKIEFDVRLNAGIIIIGFLSTYENAGKVKITIYSGKHQLKEFEIDALDDSGKNVSVFDSITVKVEDFEENATVRIEHITEEKFKLLMIASK